MIPDLKGRKMLHDRIVPRETKYIEKLQQKDTWSLALKSQENPGKVPIRKKKITLNQDEKISA